MPLVILHHLLNVSDLYSLQTKGDSNKNMIIVSVINKTPRSYDTSSFNRHGNMRPLNYILTQFISPEINLFNMCCNIV
jgi:hypothetical protein